MFVFVFVFFSISFVFILLSLVTACEAQAHPGLHSVMRFLTAWLQHGWFRAFGTAQIESGLPCSWQNYFNQTTPQGKWDSCLSLTAADGPIHVS